MKRIALLTVLMLGLGAAAGIAAEGKKKSKDPLSKFKDEQLADVGFCFQKFVESIAKKDAEVVKAFLYEVPARLGKLDLKKKADREKFLKAFAGLKSAQIVKHQRIAIAGIAVVTYALPNGGQKEQRMKNVGGRWKIVLE